jgi:hypothetical protein
MKRHGGIAFLAGALAGAAPLPARAKEPVAKAPTAAAVPSAPARIQLAADFLFDRRTTSDFPHPSLDITFKLGGEDARSVQSARIRITRAVDDTGRGLIPAPGTTMAGSDDWQPSRNEDPPQPRIELASPARKAKALTALEGVLETYMPSRDPASTVRVQRVLEKRDKPFRVAALTTQGIQLRILSKAALEKEKQQADAKKKAAESKKDGLEDLTEKMAEALASTLERLFLFTGENDLVLKVEDPGKKVFSFDVAAPDGTPIHSYGTTALGDYRIVRMPAPIPAGASLLVRLKTAKSSAETPFALADVKLP